MFFSVSTKTCYYLEPAISVSSTLVLTESGSETDDDGMYDLPPGTLVFQDDDGRM